MAGKGFGEWLRLRRQIAGLTQEELAHLCGVKRQYIIHLEHGKSSPNSLISKPTRMGEKKVRQLAGALGVNVNEALAAAGYLSDESYSDEEFLTHYLQLPSHLRKALTAQVKTWCQQLRVNIDSIEYTSIPLLGMVPAGPPLNVDPASEEKIEVPVSMMRSQYKYFALRVLGDSMDLAGIENGDIVLIQKCNEAANKQIVVAEVNQEYTLKRWRKSGSTITLLPESTNSIHQPKTYSGEQVRCIGVFTGKIGRPPKEGLNGHSG